MKAIVGLGNPGPRYRATRHNLGWLVLDRLAERWRAGRPEKARHAEVRRCLVDGETVLLVKPQTFMNDSGKAVRALLEKDKLDVDDLLVIYDDIDLAFGRLRVRPQGSAGGHRGIRSIQQHMKDTLAFRRNGSSGRSKWWSIVGGQWGAGAHGPAAPAPAAPGEASAERDKAKQEPPAFARVKAGIGRPPAGVDPIDYVLASFTAEELPVVQDLVDLAADAAECWLRDGIGVAMNRFNGLQAGESVLRKES
jgi:PTH1 family peptidyl-tRNA hydrolase